MQKHANFILLIVTMFWGSSYLFMRMGLDTIQEYNLIALRFGIAFLLAAAIFPHHLRQLDWKTVRYAFILGLILLFVFIFIMSGIKLTSTSNAAFLVSLTVIFVPILSSLVLKKRPSTQLLLGVSLALIGVGLLTLNHQLTINVGDGLCIAGALMYATHIIVTEKLTKNVDSLTLGIAQLGFTGVLGLFLAFYLEIPRFPATQLEWFSVLALSILCSAIGFIGQTVAQKHTTSTNTGLIFALEPVFAALLSFLVFGETLSIQGMIGAILILFGVIYPQLANREPNTDQLGIQE